MTCTLAIASATGPVDVLETRYSAIEIREGIEQSTCHRTKVSGAHTAPAQDVFKRTSHVALAKPTHFLRTGGSCRSCRCLAYRVVRARIPKLADDTGPD
jgi:hypothetical protein